MPLEKKSAHGKRIAARMTPSKTGMAGERIIVVEDERAVAEYVAERLTSFGYSVPAIAGTGAEALEKVAQTLPDLVVMDIRLPGSIDGVEAAALIRQRFNIPAVYLTGQSDEELLRRVKVTEPLGFLLKPFHDRELQAVIELALYQHQAEQRLKRIEHWFTATIRCMGDAVIVADADGSITLLSAAAENLTGWTTEEALGQKVSEVFRLVDAETHKEARRPFFGSCGDGMSAQLSAGSALLIGKNGSEIPIEGNVAAIKDTQGTITGLVLLFRDISQRKQAESELRGSREQLRALSARLQSVREDERGRIAREIHDELGQALTGLKMDLAWLAKRFPPGHPQLVEKAQSIMELVDHTIQSVRELATELRPSVLDDLGLIAAIEWQAEEFQARTEIQCHCDIQSEHLDLNPTQATALFRILQETLTNITRHAKATRVDIRFEQRDCNLVLEVRDNGRGISAAEISAPKSLGLLGIRERALMVGGEVSIRGEPGKGTTVTVSVPVATGEYSGTACPDD
jgi:PAS domain S-box-containing protein